MLEILLLFKRRLDKEKEPELIELELSANGSNKDSNSTKEKYGEHKVKTKRSLTREGYMACCTFKRTLEGKYEIFKIH